MATSQPVLSATTSSARQLLLLLRCISFASKAHVRISDEGIRFSVEDARVLQGIVSLDKHLFTTYQYTPPQTSEASSSNIAEDEPTSQTRSCPSFQISLPALLETLQIFGAADAAPSYNSGGRYHTQSVDPYNTSGITYNGLGAPFDSRTLGMAGLCRITYAAPGSPLCITLEEGNVTTSCELVAFEPERSGLFGADDPALTEAGEAEDEDFDIPFDRERVVQKIILPGAALAEAITELASVRPEVLELSTCATAPPHFSLAAVGDNASAQVDFSKDSPVLETFSMPASVPASRRARGKEARLVNRYKFSMINAAARAMAISAKASVRGDLQGVLSLQFMVETGAAMGGVGDNVSFVDFRFVPLLDEDENEPRDETDSE